MRNNKILKNTLALYARQVVVILISLYTLRVVLNVLGVEGYGIYSVVAGFVTLLAFLPGTMASATQRFFSFAMGQQDNHKLKETFSVNWLLYAAIALIAFIILQTAGLWYVTEHLKIPEGRSEAAISLYKMVVLSFVASIFSSPFIAIIIAHEDMHIFAFLSVVDAVLKLVAALLLGYIQGDVLELYGRFLLITAIITTSAYIIICVRKYAECQFRKIYWNKRLLKEIIDFTGWTLLGQLSTIFRNQAVTVLINQLFNPATVAARAIALTVANQVMVFSSNLNTGLYPPIIKSYAAGQKEDMLNLVFNGSKLTFFLMWVFALPMLLEMEAILKIWLKTPPPEALLFTQLALIESLILSISMPLTTAARAPGKMKLYELSLGSIQIAIFIASWLVLKAGYPAYSVFIVAIIANLLMFQVRLLLVRKLIDFPLTPYYKKVIIPVILVTFLSALPGVILNVWLPKGLLSTALVIFVCMTSATLCMYFLGLDKYWREKSKDVLISRLFKFRTKG
ncbi:O-antigen/teichoic acid export membrane protein [Psychrobacter sp. PL15]|uniref:lipopolysaccharide biosynthesis protein n=1 Tax=Psychrobacter sp. PL15 TaxID=3071719 RepID=UPI002DF86019|nr:O-antigen/teichoic acid export membrane protein [Psychrobacter sp. PL15]